MSEEVKEEFREEYSVWNNFPPELADSMFFREYLTQKNKPREEKPKCEENVLETNKQPEQKSESEANNMEETKHDASSATSTLKRPLNSLLKTSNPLRKFSPCRIKNFKFKQVKKTIFNNENDPALEKNSAGETLNKDQMPISVELKTKTNLESVSVHNELNIAEKNTLNLDNHIQVKLANPNLKKECEKGLAQIINTEIKKIEKQKPKYIALVAIDFGTTHSGYAYTFMSSPENIYLMKNTYRSESGLFTSNNNSKIPTTCLLDPCGNFHSFGVEAIDNFHDLDMNESKNWNFFEKFKMNLHNTNELNLNTVIKSINGNQFSALKIFSYSLAWFKETVLKEINDQISEKIQNENIKWILTVPAIWKHPAKSFMREAAYNANLVSRDYPDQLLIALEPEAASIYIRQLRKYQLVPEDDVLKKLHDSKVDITNMKPDLSLVGNLMSSGTRYMVVDAGGGTIDITVHEIVEFESAGYLKELYKASGGPFGSIIVDLEFENLLKNIFGQNFIDDFKEKYPASFNDLMSSFECKKRNVCLYKSNHLNINLPFAFIDYYKKRKNQKIETAINKYNNNKEFVKDKSNCVLWSSQGMLRLSLEVMKNLFQPAIENICVIIDRILNNQNVKNISYLFLVGGFSESSILQQAIRHSYSNKLQIIIPHDVSLCIVKGAILFGLNPSIIRIRRSNLTYGIGVVKPFVKNMHPEHNKIVINGKEWCKNVFDKFLSEDECVSLNETIMRRYCTVNNFNQNQTKIDFYSSDKDPYFITDESVIKCGTITLHLNESDSEKIKELISSNQTREIQIRMTFGETEIRISAVDVLTGKCVKSTIEFLEK